MNKPANEPALTATAVRLPQVAPGDNLARVIERALEHQGLELRHRDLLAVASKVISISERRTRRLDGVKVSRKAKNLARRFSMKEELAEIVLQEADQILGGVRGFLLTIKAGIMTANAGVDMKNSPRGTVTLWPRNPDESARRLVKILDAKCHKKLGALIVDSRVTPLRLGTTGIAIGAAGFKTVIDNRLHPDLYGRLVKFTRSNVADDLASIAHLLMGETDERNGVVLIRGASVPFNAQSDSGKAKLAIRRCLVSRNLRAT